MSSNATPAQHPRCPQCNEPIRPGTAFCGNCGASVSELTHVGPIDGGDDSQATATFVPVTGDGQEADFSATSEQSPWAPPGSGDYAPPPIDETRDVSAIDTASSAVHSTPLPTSQQPEGVRGLVLGTLAVLLIAAVLALYLYDAWLSESAQSTVEGWLPWLS